MLYHRWDGLTGTCISSFNSYAVSPFYAVRRNGPVPIMSGGLQQYRQENLIIISHVLTRLSILKSVQAVNDMSYIDDHTGLYESDTLMTSWCVSSFFDGRLLFRLPPLLYLYRVFRLSVCNRSRSWLEHVTPCIEPPSIDHLFFFAVNDCLRSESGIVSLAYKWKEPNFPFVYVYSIWAEPWSYDVTGHAFHFSN